MLCWAMKTSFFFFFICLFWERQRLKRQTGLKQKNVAFWKQPVPHLPSREKHNLRLCSNSKCTFPRWCFCVREVPWVRHTQHHWHGQATHSISVRPASLPSTIWSTDKHRLWISQPDATRLARAVAIDNSPWHTVTVSHWEHVNRIHTTTDQTTFWLFWFIFF